MIGNPHSGETTEIKEFLSSLIGNAPIGILAVDIDYRCMLANGRAGEVFGTRPDSLVDVPLGALIEGWPELKSRLPDDLTDRRQEFSLQAVPRLGRRYDVAARLILNGVLLTFHDVTEAVQIREAQASLVQRLESANRELAEFAYICAHDMKSPVANLVGLIGHIEQSDGVDGEALGLFEMLKRTTAGLDGKIRSLNEILAFRQTLEGSRDSCSLQAALRDVSDGLQHELEQTDATVTADDVAEDRVPLAEPHLQSVLHNLLSNAVKYRHRDRPPLVRLETRETDEHFVLAVRDNGLGLDLDRSGNKIFRLFDRIHTHVEGTGIGLYLVKSIVDSYGGAVRVESVVGEGTTFTLELPHAA